MPEGAHRECRQPRCLAYAEPDSYYCSAHHPPIERPGYADNLRPCNRRFMRARRSYLARHPVCAACKRAPASVLDHITPHRGNRELFWDQSNWQGLCFACHGRKTIWELHRRGSWNSEREREEFHTPLSNNSARTRTPGAR